MNGAAEKHRDFLEVFDVLSKVTQKPENYLSQQDAVARKLHTATKQLYDLAQSMGVDWSSPDALPELIVDGFDDEQVWQQLELNNNPVVPHLVKEVSRTTAKPSLDFHQKRQASEAKSRKTAQKRAKVTNTSRSMISLREPEEDDAESNAESSIEASDAEGDEPGHVDDDNNSSDDPLRLDKAGNDSDMSDDEREMEDLLRKARTSLAEISADEQSDDDDDDGNFDFDIGSLQKKDKISKLDDKKTGVGPQKRRRTEVDDKFFSLADMEGFLEQEDTREEKRMAQTRQQTDNTSDEEEIDYFADIPSEDEEGGRGSEGRVMYGDFFDPPDDATIQPKATKPGEHTGHGEEEDDEEDWDGEGGDEGEEEPGEGGEGESSEGEDLSEVIGAEKGQQSSYQKRQKRLKEKIGEMEEGAMAEKPWQLAGEVQSLARPENSLLQEDLDYEHTSKLAPVITEETTKSLEDLIRQRIKDKTWDDVERKVKPTEEVFQYKKRVVLDQEKSKLSLGEIYEQEYIKQQQKEEEEEKDPEHETIKKMMTSLFVKLDALSNFHYTPRQAAPEVKIINNMPSITMEEVAPVAVSDATLLAPEEVQEKQKAELKGTTEKSDTDRKRERRDKKKRQKAKHEHREAKQKALEARGLGTKQGKAKALKDLEKQSKTARGVKIITDKGSSKSGLTSSTKFFTQLQEEVTTHIHKKKTTEKKKRKSENQLSAAKYKL